MLNKQQQIRYANNNLYSIEDRYMMSLIRKDLEFGPYDVYSKYEVNWFNRRAEIINKIKGTKAYWNSILLRSIHIVFISLALLFDLFCIYAAESFDAKLLVGIGMGYIVGTFIAFILHRDFGIETNSHFIIVKHRGKKIYSDEYKCRNGKYINR